MPSLQSSSLEPLEAIRASVSHISFALNCFRLYASSELIQLLYFP